MEGQGDSIQEAYKRGGVEYIMDVSENETKDKYDEEVE